VEELERRMDHHKLTDREDFEMVTSKYVIVEHMKRARVDRDLRHLLESALLQKTATSI
jgi:hypothetical protein